MSSTTNLVTDVEDLFGDYFNKYVESYGVKIILKGLEGNSKEMISKHKWKLKLVVSMLYKDDSSLFYDCLKIQGVLSWGNGLGHQIAFPIRKMTVFIDSQPEDHKKISDWFKEISKKVTNNFCIEIK